LRFTFTSRAVARTPLCSARCSKIDVADSRHVLCGGGVGQCLADAPSPTRTVFVDVPTGDLEKYRVANVAEAIGRRPVRSYSRDPENEFFLPRQLAESRQRLPEEPVADREDGRGVYQVWHDAGWPERSGLNARFGVETPFPRGFIHVADVQAASLGQAVSLTTDAGNILDPDGDVPWQPWEMRACGPRSRARSPATPTPAT
jgi:hypothetical protein